MFRKKKKKKLNVTFKKRGGKKKRWKEREMGKFLSKPLCFPNFLPDCLYVSPISSPNRGGSEITSNVGFEKKTLGPIKISLIFFPQLNTPHTIFSLRFSHLFFIPQFPQTKCTVSLWISNCFVRYPD